MKKLNITRLAKALADLSLEKMTVEKEKEVAGEFVKLLLQHKMISKSDKIISLTQDYMLQRKGGKIVSIETARNMNASQEKMISGFIKQNDKVSYNINPDIIAGIKITINNEKQLDFSLRKKLEETFKHE